VLERQDEGDRSRREGQADRLARHTRPPASAGKTHGHNHQRGQRELEGEMLQAGRRQRDGSTRRTHAARMGRAARAARPR
jgi:hypothetical protein